jgi:hypothetical protein
LLLSSCLATTDRLRREESRLPWPDEEEEEEEEELLSIFYLDIGALYQLTAVAASCVCRDCYYSLGVQLVGKYAPRF